MAEVPPDSSPGGGGQGERGAGGEGRDRTGRETGRISVERKQGPHESRRRADHVVDPDPAHDVNLIIFLTTVSLI
jgi:hypothetical protein